MEPQGRTFHDAIIDFLPDATFVIDLDGRVIAWNKAMEALTGVLAESMLGKGDYEYALPFYKERKPMLANLIFMPEVEIEKRYDTVERIGDTLVVDIFIPDFRPGGVFFWAKASPLYDPQGNISGAIETITGHHGPETGRTGDRPVPAESCRYHQFSAGCHVCHQQGRRCHHVEQGNGGNDRHSRCVHDRKRGL